MLLVFLVLAAQYESWTLPLAIILIVPMCILSALIGVWLSVPPFAAGRQQHLHADRRSSCWSGLACKNAILIVEFAQATSRSTASDARRGDRGLPRCGCARS